MDGWSLGALGCRELCQAGVDVAGPPGHLWRVNWPRLEMEQVKASMLVGSGMLTVDGRCSEGVGLGFFLRGKRRSEVPGLLPGTPGSPSPATGAATGSQGGFCRGGERNRGEKKEMFLKGEGHTLLKKLLHQGDAPAPPLPPSYIPPCGTGGNLQIMQRTGVCAAAAPAALEGAPAPPPAPARPERRVCCWGEKGDGTGALCVLLG